MVFAWWLQRQLGALPNPAIVMVTLALVLVFARSAVRGVVLGNQVPTHSS